MRRWLPTLLTALLCVGAIAWALTLGGCSSGGGGNGGQVGRCIEVLADCRPIARVAYKGGVCVCLPPKPPPTTTTTTPTTTTTTTTSTSTTTLPPQPSPSPTVPPSTGQPAGCFPGPWRMQCRFPSCDVQGEPLASLFESVTARAGERVRARLNLPGLLPNDELPAYVRALRDELRAGGYCAADHGDPGSRVSDDEVAVWHPTKAEKEHIDVSIATGAPPGFTKINGSPFMVARGLP